MINADLCVRRMPGLSQSGHAATHFPLQQNLCSTPGPRALESSAGLFICGVISLTFHPRRISQLLSIAFSFSPAAYETRPPLPQARSSGNLSAALPQPALRCFRQGKPGGAAPLASPRSPNPARSSPPGFRGFPTRSLHSALLHPLLLTSWPPPQLAAVHPCLLPQIPPLPASPRLSPPQ